MFAKHASGGKVPVASLRDLVTDTIVASTGKPPHPLQCSTICQLSIIVSLTRHMSHLNLSYFIFSDEVPTSSAQEAC